MDKKSIIGIGLVIAIFAGYVWWMQPSEEERAEMERRADSVKLARLEEGRIMDSIAAAEALRDSLAAAGDTLAPAKAKELGFFNRTASVEPRTVAVASETMRIEFGTQGGQVDRVVLKEYTTYEGGELQLITPSADNMNLEFSTTDSRRIDSRDLVFTPYVNGQPVGEGEWEVAGSDDSIEVSMRAEVVDSATGTDGYLEFRYTVHGTGYEVDYDVAFVGLENVVHATPYLDFSWQNRMQRQEKTGAATRGKSNRNSDRERYYSNIYYKAPGESKVGDLQLGKDKRKKVQTKLEWVAFKQQYFAAIINAEQGMSFETADMEVSTDERTKDAGYLTDMKAQFSLPFDASHPEMHMGFYYGPTKMRDLRAMHRSYDRMLPLGWTVISKSISRWLIIPVFNLLERFNWNYGIIIIVFTLLIRLVLLPLVYKSYKGGAIMRILKPEMDALNKKYPKQEQAMQKQQEMMALQKRAGYNPMAGCLPVLIQMPFLTAMFMFFPIAIELRQKPFLWCDDLSNYDSILDFGTTILWQDHLSLFCLLMFGMQFFYTWYTMRQQAGTQQMPGMKFMMYFMPFMMFFIFNSQSAGLNIYYLVSLTFTMTVMILIRQFTSEKRVRAHMAAYDAKHKGNGGKKKKSSFRQRLEEMQRQAEAMQRQNNKR